MPSYVKWVTYERVGGDKLGKLTQCEHFNHNICMFSGRLGRIGLLLGCIYIWLPIVLVMVLFGLVSVIANGSASFTILNTMVYIFGAAWLIFLMVGMIGLTVRRWHDLDQSGWMALLWLVPVVNLVVGLVLLLAPGSKVQNRFGDVIVGRDFRGVLFGSKRIVGGDLASHVQSADSMQPTGLMPEDKIAEIAQISEPEPPDSPDVDPGASA
jgi:uncharacterized membrane protein YhaH (DUF805 family)